MKRRLSFALVSAASALALAAIAAQPAGAQYGPLTGGLDLPWENNRVRISRLAVAPSQPLPAAGNRILVSLTAGPDGRMPAEAVWIGSDAGAVLNTGSQRLDGISIELKDSPVSADGATPPEAVDDRYGVAVTTLINNSRVLVAKHRYGPLAYAAPDHFHGNDTFVVYLRGGYTWPSSDFWGATRVRRGDVDVIPANTLHRLANAGGDPLELLVIVVK